MHGLENAYLTYDEQELTIAPVRHKVDGQLLRTPSSVLSLMVVDSSSQGFVGVTVMPVSVV